MLRIHFTAEDLARTRIAATWGPLGETMLSLVALQERGAQGLFGGWRERVRRETAPAALPFTTIFDSSGLDLFTLTGPADSVEEGLEALLGVHPKDLEAELRGAEEVRTAYSGRTDPWAGPRLGDFAHNREDRRELVRFLHDYHRTAIGPHWSRFRSRLQAEQTDRARTLAVQGVEGMLAGLPPGFRWRPPVLEIGRGRKVSDIKLAGRGLMLVPSVFSRTRGVIYMDPSNEQAQAVVFVPVLRTAADAAHLLTGPDSAVTHKALAALLGRTRAAALEAIGHRPCTTGQLARRLAASPATASEHATVLRETGLISTARHGHAVLHTLAPLGVALLNGVHATHPDRPAAHPE